MIGSIGWFKALMPILPIPEDIKHLWALGEESIQERQAGGSLSKDIFFHIVSRLRYLALVDDHLPVGDIA